MSFAIGNVAAQVSLHAATQELAEHLAASLPSPPPIKASTEAQRQGIIIIGGDVPLHPAVAPAVAAVGDAGAAAVKGLGDALHTVIDGPVSDPGPKPAPEGGGFSGFLHTIANLGRG